MTAAEPGPDAHPPIVTSSFWRTRWPELASLAIGLWLVVSTLAFRTESSAGFNRLMIGQFVACCAVMAMWAPWFRFVNAGLGVWLLFSAQLFEHASAFLAISTAASGAALVVLASVPTPERLTDPHHAFVGYRP